MYGGARGITLDMDGELLEGLMLPGRRDGALGEEKCRIVAPSTKGDSGSAPTANSTGDRAFFSRGLPLDGFSTAPIGGALVRAFASSSWRARARGGTDQDTGDVVAKVERKSTQIEL